MDDPIVMALRKMIERAQRDGLGLDVATLVAARDAVERHDQLLAAITRHHFDSTHLAGRGFPSRLADRMLYEEAGLPVDALDVSGPMGGNDVPVNRCIVCGDTIELEGVTVDELRAEHVQLRYMDGRWTVPGRCAKHPPGGATS